MFDAYPDEYGRPRTDCAGCTEDPPDGWVNVREADPGQTSARAVTLKRRDWDPRTGWQWRASEIIFHPDHVPQWPEDQFEKVLAHERGHVLGFFHVFEGGYVMGFPQAAAWSAEESEYAQLAYRVGPNVRYPGLLRDDDLPPGDDGERAALTALYDATDGRNWTDGTHWDSGEPLARWHGVLTDDDGRVTGLSLPANNLAGPLPAELGRLTRLTLMELDRNALSGPLPASLGELTRLTELRLVANELTGPLPAELAELAELRHLSLQQNGLSGAVPAWLGGLTRLRWLDFAFNGLSGPLPAELGGLADLQALVLNRNDLSGAVPAALGDLSSLRYLEVAGNSLSGPLPASLTGLRRLETLYIEDNAGLCAPADDAFQAWLATVRGISRWGCAPNPRPALAGTP